MAVSKGMANCQGLPGKRETGKITREWVFLGKRTAVWSKNRKAPWEGPYEISEVNGKNIIIIRLGVDTRNKKKIVHESQLKLYKLRE